MQVMNGYSLSIFEMLEFYYLRDYNRNVNSGLEGNKLYIKLGLIFFIKSPLKSSPSEELLPLYKRGAIHLLKSA